LHQDELFPMQSGFNVRDCHRDPSGFKLGVRAEQDPRPTGRKPLLRSSSSGRQAAPEYFMDASARS
jgi:hypothetical protein